MNKGGKNIRNTCRYNQLNNILIMKGRFIARLFMFDCIIFI